MKAKISNLWKNFVSLVSDIVALPEDTESIRIRKTTIVLIVLAFIPINFIWTLAIFSLGLNVAAAINLTLGIALIVGVVFISRTKRFSVFLNIIFSITLIYGTSLQISLGGFINSGLVFISVLLIPLSASLLLSRRNTIFWATIYVITFTFLLAYDEMIAFNAPALPTNFGIINGFFNIASLTFLSIAMMLYLVKQLEIAQDRADTLLFNMLPQKVAARLKKKPGTIAEAYDNASILFADIVGFTPLSNQLSPTKMIDLLNQIYSQFDELVEKYGVEKIRTIGDNYLVASGVPNPRPDHAQALAYLALDMLEVCQNTKLVSDKTLTLRIGINSGSLIAGVIGSKKFQYDIWGDAVNTASRMESHGLPGKIQITKDTYEILKDSFVLTPRGAIHVKGKGEMQTWFLEGKTNN
jgi:guanylate cyclase